MRSIHGIISRDDFIQPSVKKGDVSKIVFTVLSIIFLVSINHNNIYFLLKYFPCISIDRIVFFCLQHFRLCPNGFCFCENLIFLGHIIFFLNSAWPSWPFINRRKLDDTASYQNVYNLQEGFVPHRGLT
jgi:hypothetical protein